MIAMHGDCCLVDPGVIRPSAAAASSARGRPVDPALGRVLRRALTTEDLIYLSVNESLIPFYTSLKVRPDSVNSE